MSTARRRYRRFAGRTGRLQPEPEELRREGPESDHVITYHGVLDAHESVVLAAVKLGAAASEETVSQAARACVEAERRFQGVLRRYVGRGS